MSSIKFLFESKPRETLSSIQLLSEIFGVAQFYLRVAQFYLLLEEENRTWHGKHITSCTFIYMKQGK